MSNETQTAGGRGGGRILPPRFTMTGGDPERYPSWGGRYPMGWGDRKRSSEEQQMLWETTKKSNQNYPSVPNQNDFPNSNSWKQPKEMY